MENPRSSSSQELTPDESAIWKTILAVILMGGVSVFFWFAVPQSHPVDSSQWVEKLILIPALIILIWFDFKEFRLPDPITLTLIACGIALACLKGGLIILSAFVGAAAGYLLIVLIRISFRRTSGKEGIGLGDAKLIAAVGAWYGIFSLGPALLVASVLGLLQILVVRAFDKPKASASGAIPFGPAIALSMWVMSWGQFLLPWT